MAVVVVLVFVAVVGSIVWSRSKNNARMDEWQQTATALGLSFTPGPHSARPIHERHFLPQLYGQHNGQDVYVGVRTYSTGSGSDRRTYYFTFVDVVFDPALKSGLSAERADGVSKFFGDIFGERDIQIGLAEFDREYRIKGFDYEQVRALLGHPRVAPLVQREVGVFRASITDARARFEAGGIHTDAPALRLALDAAVELYREMLDAWHELPDSEEERRVRASWTAAAARVYCRYDSRGMHLHGGTPPVSVRAEICPRKDLWTTEVIAVLDPPLGVNLAVGRQACCRRSARSSAPRTSRSATTRSTGSSSRARIPIA